MPIDNQSFDLDKDPAVLALEEFTADGQAKITAKISPELAQQQAAFAELREEIQNGAVTFGNSILNAVVPAAQAGEKTKTETNAWDNLNPDNPELAKWVDDYMKSSPKKQKATMAKLKRTKDINSAIKKVAESLPEIEPLPKNPDSETMIQKLDQIEDRVKVLKTQAQKLTNPKFRAFLLGEIKKGFSDNQENRREIRNSRGNSILNFYILEVLSAKWELIKHLSRNLGTKAAITENDMTIKIAAAEEAEHAKKEKKYREEAAAAYEEAKKIESMTPEEFMEYYYPKEKNKKLE